MSDPVIALITPLGGGTPSHPIHYPPGIWGPGSPMPAPPIVIPPIGVMPPIYIPPPGVAPPIYYPSVPSTGPGFPTNPIAPGGTTPPWGIPAPPVVWPGPTPPPPDPPTVAPPIVLPPTVWPPLGPNAPAGKTWVIAWIQGSGWHSLYVDLSQPKK